MDSEDPTIAIRMYTWVLTAPLPLRQPWASAAPGSALTRQSRSGGLWIVCSLCGLPESSAHPPLAARHRAGCGSRSRLAPPPPPPAAAQARGHRCPPECGSEDPPPAVGRLLPCWARSGLRAGLPPLELLPVCEAARRLAQAHGLLSRRPRWPSRARAPPLSGPRHGEVSPGPAGRHREGVDDSAPAPWTRVVWASSAPAAAAPPRAGESAPHDSTTPATPGPTRPAPGRQESRDARIGPRPGRSHKSRREMEVGRRGPPGPPDDGDPLGALHTFTRASGPGL